MGILEFLLEFSKIKNKANRSYFAFRVAVF